MKKAIRRNLPFDKYEIIETFSTGEGDAIICDNCGKVIKNIAVIKNSKDEHFYVGLDCAATLSGISQSDIDNAETDFKTAKRIRAKIRKYLKLGGYLSVKNKYYDLDNIHIDVTKEKNPTMVGDYYPCGTVKSDFLKKYLPELAKIAEVNLDFKELDEDKDIIITKNEETLYDGIKFIPSFETGKYGDIYSEMKLYKDNVMVAEGNNGGSNIQSLNCEAIRLYNQYIFSKGLKSLIQ